LASRVRPFAADDAILGAPSDNTGAPGAPCQKITGATIASRIDPVCPSSAGCPIQAALLVPGAVIQTQRLLPIAHVSPIALPLAGSIHSASRRPLYRPKTYFHSGNRTNCALGGGSFKSSARGALVCSVARYSFHLSADPGGRGAGVGCGAGTGCEIVRSASH